MKHALLTLALMLLAAEPALAQETFSFQGRLTHADGAPVADGSYGIQFQLFEAPTGGNPRWAEGHSVTTSGGVFSVVLGTKATLKLEAFEDTPQLQLIVNGAALSPRTLLTAVPYAMKSYRLDAEALQAGENVEINRLSDGTLQIGATGGGSGSGLSSVATDGTLEGNGTSSSPLGLADGSVTGSKLSNNALLAGSNVDIVRRGNGSWEISAAGGGGGGGLSQVASDATLAGDGTAGSPLQVADGAVTGVKLADDALVAGANVTIQRQAGGALEVASVDGGLAQVASDGTLTGDGTVGSPLRVSAPLVLMATGHGEAMRGEHSNGNFGRLGDFQAGVYGRGSSGAGVFGQSANSVGVSGLSNAANGAGVSGFISSSGYGVLGNAGGTGYGVYGSNGSNWGALGTATFGGAFSGNVIAFNDMSVVGTLSKGGGSFKIDHPLDPANKYLSHSFVESPDMMNVYNGNAITDANGEAIVVLPDYFEALNRDFRYQLTVIGQFAQAIIAEKIQGNQFVIRTDLPNVEVSWQVTGIRQDAWAEEHRIVVEEDKPSEERGYYVHPTLFGQPQEHSLIRRLAPEKPHAAPQIEANHAPRQQ